MNFAPSRQDRVLHDTWVYLDGDTVHLFYLAPQIGNRSHRLVGHAVSSDWLHWEELPFIELTGSAGSWDSGRIGTGHVFRYDDGRYCMAYTGRIDPQEDIGLATSRDLLHWEKASPVPVWPQCVEAPYESRSSDRAPAWRDPYIVRQADGSWMAYAAARVQDGPLSTRACVARARLRSPGRWETLPPIAALGAYPIMEVPEVFAFGGFCWLTFNVHSGWGKRLDTPSRRVAGGTFYLRAEQPEGPWLKPDDGLLVGSGEDRHDAVVARTVQFQGRRLVYHHYDGPVAAGSPRAMGLPKRLDLEGERLVLRPWEGLKAIQRGEVHPEEWAPIAREPWVSGRWQAADDGFDVRCDGGVAGWAADTGSTDLEAACVLSLQSGARCGLVIGMGEDLASGTTVILDAGAGEATIGKLSRAPYGMRLDTVVDRAALGIGVGQNYTLRALKRDAYTEVFLDDELVFSTITGVPDPGGTRMAAVVESGRACLRGVRIGLLEGLNRPGV